MFDISQLITFLNSNPVEAFLIGYVAERVLDGTFKTIKTIKKHLAEKPFEMQLVECFEQALEETCVICGWQYDDTAIAETFLPSLEKIKGLVDEKGLRNILEISVGNPTANTIGDKEFNTWVVCFSKAVSSTKHQEVTNYLLINGLLKSANSEPDSAAKYRLPNHQNRFHYSRQSADFLGRENEIKQLKAFCGYDEDMHPVPPSLFSWWLVYGEGGSGKSRLCFEFANYIQEYGWSICFPPDHSEKTLWDCSENLPNDTLFVLDYSEFDMGTISPWLLRLYRRNYQNNRIRVLLVQRRGGHIKEEIWEYTDGKELMDSLYSNEFLHIPPLSEEDLCGIISSYALKAKQKKLTGRDRKVIYKRLNGIDETLVRPLYAQILTDAYCDDTNMRRWSREDALDYICDKEKKEILRAIEVAFIKRTRIDYQDIQKYGLRILCMATMTGGMDMGSEFEMLMPKEAGYFQDSETVRKDFYSLPQLFSPIGKTYCAALEPDIIGEYFVIMHWRDGNVEQLISGAWKKPYHMDKFIARLFQDHGNLLSNEQKTLLCNVNIPEGVTCIEDYDFKGCSSLTRITLPSSIKYIGKSAFFGCSSLISINLPRNLKTIGESAFFGCKKFTAIIIPESVTSIGAYAFADNSSLTCITLPDSITSIGISAFQNCMNLTSIILPNFITSIGKYDFLGCNSLTSIILQKRLKKIEEFAFSDCGSLTSITLTDSIECIGDFAFYGCSSLTDVYIHGKLTPVIKRAFYKLGVTFHEIN